MLHLKRKKAIMEKTANVLAAIVTQLDKIAQHLTTNQMQQETTMNALATVKQTKRKQWSR